MLLVACTCCSPTQSICTQSSFVTLVYHKQHLQLVSRSVILKMTLFIA